MAPTKTFPPGIHVPTLTWFEDTPTQEIDWDLQKQHLEFLVNSGIQGSKHGPCSPP
jgi:4-hydroxy-2-oxoglutarate aldolase